MNKTVLIIDDDDMLRQSLVRGLRNADFNTISANSAENATDILAKITVDAIVLDRMMTGIDGLTFLKQLRTSGDRTPIIMLTAMTGPENSIDGLAGGADDYLGKPFQIRELILRMNNIIKKSDQNSTKLPSGLIFSDNEFFVQTADGSKLLTLSGEEKKLLQYLTNPMGNIVMATPMVAKRLRGKLNIVLSNLDIITIRGRGYKLIDTATNNRTNK